MQYFILLSIASKSGVLYTHYSKSLGPFPKLPKNKIK
jgi:hypothetical protein